MVSCVVSGNSIPDFLLPPADDMDGGSGSSYGGGGMGATARILSRSSRGTASLESGGPGYTLEFLRGTRACFRKRTTELLCYFFMFVGHG